MSTVTQKYLKDENGDIISPITSAKSVMIDRGNFASTVEGIIPYTYRIQSGGKTVTSQLLFQGAISNWTMIKAHLLVMTDSITDSRAIDVKLNNTDITTGYGIDARRRDGKWDSYNPVDMKVNVYLGDIAYGGFSSYVDFTIINDTTEWHTFKSFVSTVTGTSGQYSLSACSGEFQHPNSKQNITQINLCASQGIKAHGILQIYK